MIDKILLKVQVYFLRRPKFRVWCESEDRKYDFIQAVEDNSSDLPKILESYLSTALYFRLDISKIPWQDVFEAFYKIHNKSSTIRKIPITSSQDKSKTKKDAWDYSGRLWYLYANIIASAYGWTQEYISELDVDDALAYLQEILTDKQLEKEFIWQTTELAYEHKKGSKYAKLRPLDRPYWMRGYVVAQRKATPIPKALLPVGNVIRIRDHYETKKPESRGDVESISPSETIG